MSETDDAAAGRMRAGVTALAAATVAWGLLPAFWKELAHLPPVEVLGWRILWTSLLTFALLVALGRWRPLLAAYRDGRQLAATALSSLLINGNGYLFIWGVAAGRVTEVSLGYYVTPLFNVLLGVLVLGERLTRLQWVALAIAAAGVVQLGAGGEGLPLLALGLVLLFGLYGLVRKMAPVEPLVGLHLEMTLAAPVGLFVLSGGDPGLAAFAEGGAWQRGLLVLAGVFTAAPLYFFAFGAKRLPYALVGVFLYVAPSLQLALATLAYGEVFTRGHAITFGCLWLAIALYLGEQLRLARAAD